MNFFLFLTLFLSTSNIDDYTITIGDKLLISVYGSVSFSYEQTVTSGGEIFIQYVSSPPSEEAPFIAWEVLDVLEVAGKTIRDATIMTEDMFRRYFKDVRVNLSVVSFYNPIYITGAVVRPGRYPFLPGRKMRNYMDDAGGILPCADLLLLSVTRGDSIIDVSPESIVEESWSIYIPKSYIYVSGMVTAPGARPFDPRLTGLDYIGMAGGPVERADIKKAHIVTKDGEKLSITDHPPMYSTVVVPEVGMKWWQDYITIASALTTIMITWITITK